MNMYDVKAGKEFRNLKDKVRIVFEVQRSYTTNKTRVLYTNTKNGSEAVKSCYMEQFVKWANS